MARRTSEDVRREVKRLSDLLGPDFEVNFQQGNGAQGVSSTLRITRAGWHGAGSTYHMGGSRPASWQWLATFNEGIAFTQRQGHVCKTFRPVLTTVGAATMQSCVECGHMTRIPR